MNFNADRLTVIGGSKRKKKNVDRFGIRSWILNFLTGDDRLAFSWDYSVCTGNLTLTLPLNETNRLSNYRIYEYESRWLHRWIRRSQGIRVLSTGRTNDFHRQKAPMLGGTTWHERIFLPDRSGNMRDTPLWVDKNGSLGSTRIQPHLPPFSLLRRISCLTRNAERIDPICTDSRESV